MTLGVGASVTPGLGPASFVCAVYELTVTNTGTFKHDRLQLQRVHVLLAGNWLTGSLSTFRALSYKQRIVGTKSMILMSCF